MTIKEFALLAGVSVSTVSKIMNGKDASISARTREHVLKLAKEYNYVQMCIRDRVNEGLEDLILLLVAGLEGDPVLHVSLAVVLLIPPQVVRLDA